MKIRHPANDLRGRQLKLRPGCFSCGGSNVSRLDRRRYVPAVAGVAGIAGSVIVADVVAIRSDRPTISAAVASAMEHDWLAPLVLGSFAGLAWHLIAHPIIKGVRR